MKQTYKCVTVAFAGIVGIGVASGTALASAPSTAEAAGPAAHAAQPALDQYATGKVTSRHRLAVRSRPTTHSKRVYWLKPGQRFQIKCWTRGQKVGHTRVWYRMGYSSPKDWVTANYVKVIKGHVHHC